MTINFKIEHIDPLGQGVFKEDDKVYFIKKTLPGESGTAEIISKRKGVLFAKATEIKDSSPERISPSCPHFNECNGCDFLHTNYVHEKIFKLNALKRHLFKFNLNLEIEYIEAKNRFNYRNRIQLHYDKKRKTLGMYNQKFEIVSVPDCIISDTKINEKLRDLYQDSSWLHLIKDQSNSGHIELYLQDDNVKISINKNYAEGGFTQVNQKMNDLLKTWLLNFYLKNFKSTDVIYDLFGGNGNLTSNINNPTLVVDNYLKLPKDNDHQIFFSKNLYDDDAINLILDLKKKGMLKPNWIIFDPPRSGIKNLKNYLTSFTPEGFIYIACDPTSFSRDCSSVLDEYEVKNIALFDLFPGTHHFETVGIFTRRKNSK